MFNPADYEVIENLRTRENKNFERITRQSKKQFQILQLKYPGFFDQKTDKETREAHPIPNLTHPENDTIFLQKPPKEQEESPVEKPKVYRERHKPKNLIALAEALKKVPRKFYMRATANCHDISENLHAQHLLE